MSNEIIYVCKSINNKNIRENELKFLRKVEEELCFEFGESQTNMKKRFYKNLEALNKDFEEVKKLKEDFDKKNKKSKDNNLSDTQDSIKNIENKKIL